MTSLEGFNVNQYPTLRNERDSLANIGYVNDILEAEGGGGGIEEAPTDGKLYGRQSSAWTEITGSGPVPATVQTPFLGTYDGTNNVFTLPKTPVVVFDVLGLSDTHFVYFENSEISVDSAAKTVTITSTNLESGMRIKINYTAI